MSNKLKLNPCYFCDSGETDIFATHDPKNATQLLYWQVKCKDCGAAGPAYRKHGEAAVGWNALKEKIEKGEICKRN